MFSRLHLVSWLFPTVLCICLSVIYFFEWRSSRADQRQAATAFVETVKAINNKLAFESTQTRSLLKAIGEGIDRLSKQVDASVGRGDEIAALKDPPSESEKAPPSPPEGEGAEVLAEVDLPPLPPDTNPRKVLESFDVREFYANPAFNPTGKEPDRTELLKAENLITRAQARLMTLRSDLGLLVGEGMAAKFEEGLFVDYEKGQNKISQPGVFTSGESIDGGGMRIYYFPPEEYPRLYEIRKEMRTIPEETVRRLMALAAK
jgi:hypothetical protein